MDRLQRTILHLEMEEVIQPTQIIVLVCPPLTEKRFNKESKRKNFIQKLITRPKEFTSLQLRFLQNWQQYKERIANKIIPYLHKIETELHMSVVVDANYKDFKTVIKSKEYQIIFLIAHQMDGGLIEFADGGIKINKLSNFLTSIESEKPISLLFFICEFEDIEKTAYGKIEGIQSIASNSFKMPLTYSVEFIYYWTFYLKGGNKLSEAYHLAINSFINKYTKNSGI